MSIRTVSASPTTSNADLDAKTLKTSNQWRRNPQWLTLPTVLSTEQKMVGLHAIFPLSNFIALVASGDYTIDWGDGVTENFASGVVAYHEYDYANSAFDGTLTDDGYKQAIVTITPQSGQNLTYLNLNQKHNQTNLQKYTSGFLDITVSSSTLTDLKVGTYDPSTSASNIYFNLLEQFNLINSDCKQLNFLFYNLKSLQSVPNFVISSSNAINATVTFTDTGDLITLASHGFKNGNSVIFKTITSTTGISVNTLYYIINATTDTFQVSTSYGGSPVVLTTDGSGVVAYGASMNYMFAGCSALNNIQLFNTINSISMFNMFTSCSSLTTVPLFNTINVATMATMFSNCRSLITVPLFNTINVTTMATMFSNCTALTTVPLFNTSSVTTMSGMFNSCSSLTTVPLFNTVSVTTMDSMFNNCIGLTTVPLFNTVAVTVTSSMFTSCSLLTTVPLFNTVSVTNMNSMFSSCSSLITVPIFNTSSVSNMGSMFNTCTALTTVPALVTTAVTASSGFSNMFNTCPSLTRIEAKNFRFTFSVTACKLSSTSLDEIYTNLPTVTGQTITVTNNYGATGDTPSIATAKGWTVTG